jgi:NAD(P)-dependent dehydrogenase (short-subunit alcohol dehydrogenase family)
MALAAEGASIMVADTDDIDGTETVRRIEEDLGGAASFVKVDVAYPHDVRTMYSATEATFGGVDIVQNNAGLSGGEPSWPDAELERMMRVIAVNIGGVAMGTQEGIRALRRRGGGCIVNTASVSTSSALPTDPVGLATEAAVVRITESCASFAAEGIRVNAVLSGMVDAGLEDVAAAVVNLVRDGTAVAEARVVAVS